MTIVWTMPPVPAITRPDPGRRERHGSDHRPPTIPGWMPHGVVPHQPGGGRHRMPDPQPADTTPVSWWTRLVGGAA